MWDNTTFFLPLIYDSDQWPTMDVLQWLSSSSASQDSRLKTRSHCGESSLSQWISASLSSICASFPVSTHSESLIHMSTSPSRAWEWASVDRPPPSTSFTSHPPPLVSLSLLLLSPTCPWQTLLWGCPWTSSYRVQKPTQMISLVASKYLTRPAHTTCPDSSNPQNYTTQIQVLFQFITPPNQSHPRCHQQLLCAVHHTNYSSAQSTHASTPFWSQKRWSRLFLCPRETFQW